MALVNGPLFSLAATGALADTIVFSRWKGRPYVRELVTPANPKSAGQVGMRAMLRFVSQNWAAISSGFKDNWADLADAQAISKFNAYSQFNLREWRDFYAPSQKYPATRSQSVDDATTFTAATVGRDIQIDVTAAAVNAANWGVVLHRALSTGFTPNWNNAIAAIYCASGDSIQYFDGPLDADTYYYRCTLFTADGNKLVHAAEVDDTVV